MSIKENLITDITHSKPANIITMAEFFLSTVGFGELGEQTLQALLTLSERALASPWQYVKNVALAHAALVCMDSPEGENFWRDQTSSYPSMFFVACSSQEVADAKWKLSLPSSQLPSRKELIELLNAMARQIGEGAAAKPPPTRKPGVSGPSAKPVRLPEQPKAHATPSPTGLAAGAAQATYKPKTPTQQPGFDPAQYFLGLLQTAIAAAKDTIFVLPGQIWLVATPKTQRYYSALSGDKLQVLLSATPGEIQLRQLPVEKVLESPWAKDVSEHPLDELLWHAALASSGGRLLLGKHPEDIVRLKQWPQVAHLPSYRKFLRIAAFMNHNAASLQTIAERTGAPLESVFDFHNACAAMGLIEASEQADMADKPPSSEARDLYRKISSRLARAEPGGGKP